MTRQRICEPRGAILPVLALVVACHHTPSMVVSAWGKGPELPKPARPAVLKRSDDKDPFAYLEVGDRMLGRGRADSAAAAFYWASLLDPTIARPYYARSVALLLAYVRPQRDTTGAALWEPKTTIPRSRLLTVDSLRGEALARDPFLPPSYDHLFTGRPPISMGDAAAARRAFEDAIGENAAFYPAHARLATLASERGDPVTAAAELAAAIELAPNDPSLRFFYGAALLESSSPDRAIGALLAAIDLDPWFAKPYLYLGKAYETRGDFARAIEAYEEFASRERINDPERLKATAHADLLRARTNR